MTSCEDGAVELIVVVTAVTLGTVDTIVNFGSTLVAELFEVDQPHNLVGSEEDSPKNGRANVGTMKEPMAKEKCSECERDRAKTGPNRYTTRLLSAATDALKKSRQEIWVFHSNCGYLCPACQCQRHTLPKQIATARNCAPKE